MVESLFSPRLLEQIRQQTIEVEPGFSVEIVNIGDPTLDTKLDPVILEKVLANLELIRVGNRVTIIFDNRSYPKAIKYALLDLKDGESAGFAFEAIFRTLGSQGSASKDRQLIYINTQEIAFFETIGMASLDETTKHELAHLTQKDIDSSSQGLKNLIAMLIEAGGSSAMAIKTVHMVAQGSPITPLESLKNVGFIMLSLGFMRLSKQLLYLNAENEKDADMKSGRLKEFVLVNNRPQMLTERMARSLGSKIRQLFT